jgi:rod shape-determining protein MreD
MLSILLSIPVLSIAAILQSAVVSRITILQGSADLVLVLLAAYSLQKSVSTAWQWAVVGGLLVDYLSGLPFGIFLFSYLALTAVALILRERVWRFSFLMMLLVVFLGTALSHAAALAVLLFQGVTLNMLQVIQSVTLPSLVLNFMLSLPVYLLLKDTLQQFQSQEVL